jgi:hypothetical protein
MVSGISFFVSYSEWGMTPSCPRRGSGPWNSIRWTGYRPFRTVALQFENGSKVLLAKCAIDVANDLDVFSLVLHDGSILVLCRLRVPWYLSAVGTASG